MQAYVWLGSCISHHPCEPLIALNAYIRRTSLYKPPSPLHFSFPPHHTPASRTKNNWLQLHGKPNFQMTYALRLIRSWLSNLLQKSFFSFVLLRHTHIRTEIEVSQTYATRRSTTARQKSMLLELMGLVASLHLSQNRRGYNPCDWMLHYVQVEFNITGTHETR